MRVPIPQYLSRPMCVLWWETDELVVGAMSFSFGMLIGGWIPIVLALAAFMAYRHFRKEAGRGFVNHLPYILGFKAFEGFPHAYVDKFEE